MAPSDSYATRAKSRATKAAGSVKKVLAVIGAGVLGVVAFGGQVVPFLTAGLLEAIGWALGGAVAVVVALAAWLRSNSDERNERLAWLVVLILGLAALWLMLKGV